MDLIYSILINSLPFIASFAAYWLLMKRVLKMTSKIGRIVVVFLLLGGIGFTLYQLFLTYSDLNDSNFNFTVIISNVVTWAVIAVIITAVEPEQNPPAKDQ